MMLLSKKITTALMLLIFVATWIKPNWPVEQALHTSLTLVAFVSLWFYNRKYALGERDFLLIAVFISAHCIAARWLYSYTPYDKWLQSTLGYSLQEHWGWTRNNFDRLVHFLYGFCFTPAICAYVMQRYQQSLKVGFYIAITTVMVTSLWYEWFEWLIAITLSAQNAEAYNGQQGDMWDAHKDMLMATIGSLVWVIAYRKVLFNTVKTSD